MALVVEDGTGRADAESYCSVATANAYHLARGNAAWAALASDTLREQALRNATDYMAVYRARLAGYRLSSLQALDWPRYMVPMKDAFLYPGGISYYPSNSVPVGVQNACAELALKAAAGTDLTPDLDPPVVREKVGPLETEYLPGTRQTTTFFAADLLLQPFLCGDGNSMKVSRA